MLNAKQPDTWMFHQSEAPKGLLFLSVDLPQLKRKGWVDTPEKFRKRSLRSRYQTRMQAVRTFWSIVFHRN